MKNLFYFIIVVGFVNIGLAKSDIDTIQNWQIHKDSELLFKSNILDSNRYHSIIRKSEKYKYLYVKFYSKSRRSYRTKIEFVCGSKILLTVKNNTDCFKIRIPKKQIDNSLKSYFGKEIFVKYFDDEYPNGIVLGVLTFENK